MIEKTYVMSFVIATSSVLLALLATTISYIPSPASAQIIPSASIPDSSASPPSSVLPKSLQSADSGMQSTPQGTAAPIENSTTSNITQLATVLPTAASQPITPSSFVPVSDNADDSDDSDDNGDDENDQNDQNDGSSNDDNNDDSGDDESDNDGSDNDGGSSVAIAGGGGGGAFASAG